MGWLDDLWNNSWVDQGVSAVSDFAGDLFSGSSTPSNTPSLTNKDDKDDKDDSLWSSLLNHNVLGSVITAGSGLLSNMSKLDLDQQTLEQQKEKDKFAMLVELAKLKYGAKGGGGGGGSQRNANADLIEVLMKGAENKSNSLNNLAKNYAGAIT